MLFRTFVFLSVLTTAGSAAFGQVGIAHEAHAFTYYEHDVTFNLEVGPNSDESMQRVRSALNLSDAQINGLKALMTMRQQTIDETIRSAEDAQRKLEEVMKQPNPNPTELGTAFLAVRSIHEGVSAAEQKFRTDFKSLLTAEQRSTLDKLKAASDQLHALRGGGILQSVFLEPFTMPMLSGIEPGFAIGFHGQLSNQH
jgi:Spy/CpxP family protein refolding chaperone